MFVFSFLFFSEDQPFAYKDAVFISTHKFVGGVQTPGILVAKKNLFRNPVPSNCGGGSVFFVSDRCPNNAKRIFREKQKQRKITPQKWKIASTQHDDLEKYPSLSLKWKKQSHFKTLRQEYELLCDAQVRRESHRYLQEAELREEGGTPAIVESIRAGLVFQLKEAVTSQVIMAKEHHLFRCVPSCHKLLFLVPNKSGAKSLTHSWA